MLNLAPVRFFSLGKKKGDTEENAYSLVGEIIMIFIYM